jgi:hypothetical protein
VRRTRTSLGFSSSDARASTLVVSAFGSFSRTNSVVARTGERARSGWFDKKVLNPSTAIAPDSSGGGGPFQSAISPPIGHGNSPIPADRFGKSKGVNRPTKQRERAGGPPSRQDPGEAPESSPKVPLDPDQMPGLGRFEGEGVRRWRPRSSRPTPPAAEDPPDRGHRWDVGEPKGEVVTDGLGASVEALARELLAELTISSSTSTEVRWGSSWPPSTGARGLRSLPHRKAGHELAHPALRHAVGRATSR